MAERAAERAAVAGLAMADLEDRLVHEREAPLHAVGEFEIALARHRAELRARRRSRRYRTRLATPLMSIRWSGST